MNLRKELLYLVGFLLLGNTTGANLDSKVDYSSLDKIEIKCSSEDVEAVKGRTDKECIININNIIMIESSGDPKAYNESSGARGLMQITPKVLKEWNSLNSSQQHTLDDLFNEEINIKLGSWYLDRIKDHYLPHYGLKGSIENIIVAYNWGIGNLKGMVRERYETLRSMSEPGEPNFQKITFEDGKLGWRYDSLEEYLSGFSEDDHFLRTENREFHLPKNTVRYIRRYKEMQEEIQKEIEELSCEINFKNINSLPLETRNYIRKYKEMN